MVLKYEIDTADSQLFVEPVFIAGLGKSHGYKYCILVKDETKSAESIKSNLQSYWAAVPPTETMQSYLSELEQTEQNHLECGKI
jgi:hypothetical protein